MKVSNPVRKIMFRKCLRHRPHERIAKETSRVRQEHLDYSVGQPGPGLVRESSHGL